MEIISHKVKQSENIAVVLSAREKATDQLEAILDKAASGMDYKEAFEAFEKYQQHTFKNIDLSEDFQSLVRILEGVAMLGDYSPKIKDQVLAYGEIISGKLITKLLIGLGIDAKLIDSRNLIKTDDTYGDAKVLEDLSRENVIKEFSHLKLGEVAVITGFIASTAENETTTLGRNGSNYTASMLANFLDAGELQNYTHVNGIYTANPDLVPEAQRITHLSYSEANEIANFGATILHAKTIIPLIEKNIPLRILNTFNNDDEGTLISARSSDEGIKSLSVLENEALINLEGRGLLGKVGIDARIFRTLSRHNINVSIISQGSSERGIGLVVNSEKAKKAKAALEYEFETDFRSRDINTITIVEDVSVISIIGQDLSTFHKPYNALIKNQIVPLLFNNSVSGKNIGLVVKKSDLHKALNVMHGQIFGISKKVNLAIFGHGNVGGTLMDQLVTSARSIEERKGIQLNVFALANSRKLILNQYGIKANWKEEIEQRGKPYILEDVFEFARQKHLENLIAVDNTANEKLVSRYFEIIENGFDLVSSNKIGNTLGFDFYQLLREDLKKHQKRYLYETNVGAGLPLIDTIRLLHLSGENITRIKGVFSGSLSYIFNTFSQGSALFSEILKDAMKLGYTEPDPREDLSGNDVGRKLLILARELDLHNEFEEIRIQNLIPDSLKEASLEEFMGKIQVLDNYYDDIERTSLRKPGEVLRYVGESASGDLHEEIRER